MLPLGRKSRPIARLGLVAAVLVLLVAPTSSSGVRRWSKHRQQIPGVAGACATVWTTIYTNDERSPFLERVLYRDEWGHLLVIRTVRSDDPDSPGSTRVEHVPTGEALTFEVQHRDTFVVTAPGHRLSAGREALAALRPDGADFPDEIEAEAAVLLGSLTPELRETLHGLAQTGCSRAVDLYPVARRVGLLFFDDVPCGTAPRASPTPTDWVVDFDPAAAEPGELERAFGAAYRE